MLTALQPWTPLQDCCHSDSPRLLASQETPCMGEARRRASRGYRPGIRKHPAVHRNAWLLAASDQAADKPVHGDHHAGSLGRHRRTGGVLGGGALYRSSSSWWTLADMP